jgi:hypothetical protein
MITKSKFARGIVAGLVASLAVLAIAGGVASASTPPLHWYAGGSVLPAGTSTAAESGGTTFTMGWTWAGVSTKYACSGQKGAARISNPSGGGAAQQLSGTLTFSGCIVNQPGCVVHSPGQPAGTILISGLVGVATEVGSAAAMQFQSASGPTLVTLETNSCLNTGLNGTKEVSGSFTPRYNNLTSQFEYEPSNESLKIGTNGFTVQGRSKLTTTGGQTIELKP